MKGKDLKWACLLMACVVGVAFGGATFRWTDEGTGSDWDDTDNWEVIAGVSLYSFPGSPDDDAIIPKIEGGWDYCDLVTETIDDLTIDGDIEFRAASGSPTLTVDTLTITAATVVMDGATIVVESLP